MKMKRYLFLILCGFVSWLSRLAADEDMCYAETIASYSRHNRDAIQVSRDLARLAFSLPPPLIVMESADSN